VLCRQRKYALPSGLFVVVSRGIHPIPSMNPSSHLPCITTAVYSPHQPFPAPTPELILRPAAVPAGPALCRRALLGIGIPLGAGMPEAPAATPSSSSLEYVPRLLGVRNSPSNSSSPTMPLMLAE
jgi:hypothetical protein